MNDEITLPQAIRHMRCVAQGGSVQADFADDLEVILSALEMAQQAGADLKNQLDIARRFAA